MNISWIIKNYHIFLPLLFGMLFGGMCPMNNTGYKTNSQPPGWVFGIVWPVLYILIGLNWNNTKNDFTLNLFHWMLIVALNYWVYVVGCKNDWRQGGFVFLPIVGLSLATWIMSAMKGYPLMIIPYLTWILFAQQLNVHIVENSL